MLWNPWHENNKSIRNNLSGQVSILTILIVKLLSTYRAGLEIVNKFRFCFRFCIRFSFFSVSMLFINTVHYVNMFRFQICFIKLVLIFFYFNFNVDIVFITVLILILNTVIAHYYLLISIVLYKTGIKFVQFWFWINFDIVFIKVLSSI